MLTGRDIIVISSVDWDFIWQNQQEVCSRLARAGNRVLYVENTGVRAPGLQDTRRVLRRLSAWFRSWCSRRLREVAPNLYVCSPVVMPPFGTRWRRWLNRRFFLAQVRCAANRLGLRDMLIWTYLPTDTAADLIRMLSTPQSVVIYYCVDNFGALTPHVGALRKSEQSITKLSDVVFATCQELAEHCRQWNDNVHVFPNGVNLAAFPPEEIFFDETGRHSHDTEALTLLRSLSRPIVGYAGGIAGYLDIKLLETMARARPDWSWVFVGPVNTSIEGLSRLPNVHLRGQRPHQELVHYMRGFDVCIVPYTKSLHTDTVVPTKVNEYLATGKPVVSTEIPTVLRFNERHKVLLTAPARPESFLQAIERALRLPNDAAAVSYRRKIAALSDWEVLLERMTELIAPRLRARAKWESAVQPVEHSDGSAFFETIGQAGGLAAQQTSAEAAESL